MKATMQYDFLADEPQNTLNIEFSEIEAKNLQNAIYWCNTDNTLSPTLERLAKVLDKFNSTYNRI